jgi:hypothetical protein
LNVVVLVAIFAGLENAFLQFGVVNARMGSGAFPNVCRFTMRGLTGDTEILVHVSYLDGFLKPSAVNMEPVFAAVA